MYAYRSGTHLQTTKTDFASVDPVARGVLFDASRATMAAML